MIRFHALLLFVQKNPIKSFFGLTILGLPVLLHFLFWGLVSVKQPKYSGEIYAPGIQSSVEVIRDVHGIPHIFGKDAKSTYFALGYTMAQDRLFQMELQRRVGRGELSEIFGEKLLPTDKFLKSLLLKKTAEEYAKAITPLEPEAWIQLDAFLEGVNFYIKTGSLPIEYTILGIQARPFDRVDAISFLYYMGFSFAEGIRSDSLFTILQSELKGRVVSELFPRYDFELGASILEHQPGQRLLASSSSVNPNRNQTSAIQTPIDPKSYSLLLDTVNTLEIPIPPLLGSNSWVIAPSRSSSGGAILANDPHIALSNPGTWYEAYVEFPGYENYGYFLSILPFPLIAHNRDKAWALTMLEQDDVNLYAETVEGSQVLEKGSWKELVEYKDFIPQKSGSPLPYSVLISSHGPLITEHIKGYKGRPISLYWTHHHTQNPLLEVLYRMGKAKTVTELDNASALIVAPGLNFSYADASGNIAYYSVGRFPILKSGNSRKILEGSTGENDVIGYVKENPKRINPKEGMIVTANNLVTEGALPGLGKPEGNWQPADRFLRLKDVLAQKEKWSLEELSHLQNDTVSSFAPEYIDILRRHGVEPKTAAGKLVLNFLYHWDYSHTLDSQGAVAYDVFYYLAMKELMIDELGEERFQQYNDFADSWNAYRHFVREPNSLFWDDQRTVGKWETQKEILERSLDLSGAYLETYLSRSPSLWTWSRLYKVKHPHPFGVLPLIGSIFEIGPFPSSGGSEVINNLKYKLSKEDWTAFAGPSKRRVIDFGRFSESVTQLPIGNSGNLGSPYYKNFVEDYREGRARRILYGRDLGKETTTLHLLPNQK